MRRIWPIALALVVCVLTAPALAIVPDSLEVACDVDRTAFRSLAGSQASITFRLWNAVSGGSQCGGDHVVPMAGVLGLRPKGDKFDGQRPRKFLELRTVLGTDGNSGTPVQICTGAETWIDVQVGTTTLTCDFSADPNSKQGVLPDAPARRRLPVAAYAHRAGEADAVRDVSARVYDSSNIPIADNMEVALAFPMERWDTDTIHDTVSDTKRLTAKTAGKYFIFGGVDWETNPSGVRKAILRLNGTTEIAAVQVSAVSGGRTTMQVSTHYQLEVDDYVELLVLQTSGGSLQVLASFNNSPEFGMVRVP